VPVMVIDQNTSTSKGSLFIVPLGIIYFIQADLAIGLTAQIQYCFKYIIPVPLLWEPHIPPPLPFPNAV
jgi:hypothetical protein